MLLFTMKIFVFFWTLILVQSAPRNVVIFADLKPVLIDFLGNNMDYEDPETLLVKFSRQNPHSVTQLELLQFLESINVQKHHEVSQHIFDEVIKRVQMNLPGSQKVIIEFPNEGETITVNELNLNGVLNRNEIKDRKIVAVSIVGYYRKGKSFLLDYFLRYLYFTYPSLNLLNQKYSKTSANWTGLPDEPLRGFSWKDGVDRHTTGIVLWSDVFLHDADNGEKFAIILIDTQGLFEHDTPEEVYTRIFSFTTFISSVQIYNLPSMIYENKLQYLQFATEFAKFSMKDKGTGKPFEHLLFLLRDWENTEDYDYGFDDGGRYLDYVLKIKENQQENMKELRRFIKASFTRISCFLLPHPGEKIYHDKFNGSWSNLDEIFINQLENLVHELFSPENLVAKKINRKDATVSDYLMNLKMYAKIFASNKVASAQSIYEASVSVYMNQLIKKYVDLYRAGVSNQIPHLESFLDFENVHLTYKDQATKIYNKEQKMGNKNHLVFYQNLLISEIDRNCEDLNKTATAVINAKILEKKKNDRDAGFLAGGMLLLGLLFGMAG